MCITEPGMVTDRLWTAPWVAALPKGHALASERALELADRAREPLAVLAPDPSGMSERQIIEHLPTVDSPLFIAERPTTALALMTWVEAGCGMGLLTAAQGEGVAHPNVILRPFRRGLPPAEIHLLRSDAPPAPLLSGLIECLRANRASPHAVQPPRTPSAPYAGGREVPIFSQGSGACAAGLATGF